MSRACTGVLAALGLACAGTQSPVHHASAAEVGATRVGAEFLERPSSTNAEWAQVDCKDDRDCRAGESCISWGSLHGEKRACLVPCRTGIDSVVGCPDGTSCMAASHLPPACGERPHSTVVQELSLTPDQLLAIQSASRFLDEHVERKLVDREDFLGSTTHVLDRGALIEVVYSRRDGGRQVVLATLIYSVEGRRVPQPRFLVGKSPSPSRNLFELGP